MKEMLPKIIVILGICIIFIICAFLFVRLYFSIKLENKLKKFTVNVDENNTISFIDKLMIKNLYKFAEFSTFAKFLRTYTNHYNEYIL